MPKFLFRSRWFALGWVLLTLASIGAFFSENGGASQIDQAADTIREQKQQMDELAGGEPAAAEPAAGPATVAEEAADALAPEADAGEETGKTVRLVKAAAAEDEDMPPADEGDTYVVLDKSAAIPEADY